MLDQILNSPFNVGSKTLFLLVVLVVLEAVLSADNAIALAALSQSLHYAKLERRALDIGLGIAYVLRMMQVVSATWIIQLWQFELAGAIYLLGIEPRFDTVGEIFLNKRAGSQKHLFGHK